AGLYFISKSVNHPHGEWDAYATWNMRSRLLVRVEASGDVLLETLKFQDRQAQPDAGADYPLLLPSLIARAWTYLGGDSPVAPVAVAFLFTFATPALLIASLAVLRSTSRALVGGTLLVSTQFFLWLGAAQYADVPMAYFILATLVLMALHDERFP